MKLVAELVREAIPQGQGAMAAVFGLDDEKTQEVCVAAAGDEAAEAVLTGLNRRIDRVIVSLAVFDPDTLIKTMETCADAG